MSIFLTMKRAVTLYLAPLFFLVCAPLAGYSFDIIPFHTQNQSPVARIFGLPAIGNSRILKAGDKELTLVLDIANNYADLMPYPEFDVIKHQHKRIMVS